MIELKSVRLNFIGLKDNEFFCGGWSIASSG